MTQPPSPFPRITVEITQDQHRVHSTVKLWHGDRVIIHKKRSSLIVTDTRLDGYVTNLLWGLVPRLAEEAVAQETLPI